MNTLYIKERSRGNLCKKEVDNKWVYVKFIHKII